MAPCDSVLGAGSGAGVGELGEVASVKEEAAQPWEVTLGLDDVIDLVFHEDGPGVCLPWPGQVRPDGELVGGEGGVGHDAAVLDDNTCAHLLVGGAVGGDDVLLVLHGHPEEDGGVLDQGACVAEDEVNGSGDLTVAVELALGVCVQGVLVTPDGAVKEG